MNPNQDPNKNKDDDEDMENQDQVNDFFTDDDEGEIINRNEVYEEEEIDKDNQMNLDIDIDEVPDSVPYHQEYPEFRSHGEIYSIALHQSTGTVIIGDGEDITTFYDINKKEIIVSNKYNKDSVNFLKFSYDDKYLVSASIDGSLIVFDPNNQYKVIAMVDDQKEEINWLEWYPKGPAFAFGASDGSVWVYKATAITSNMSFFHHTASTTCGAFSNDGTLLISASEDSSVRVYNLKEKSLLHTIKGKKFHQGEIMCLSIAKSKSLLATGSAKNEIALTNYENGNVLFFLANNEEASIESIVFGFDDKYVVYADSLGKVSIFDLSQMQVRSVIKMEEDNITKMVVCRKNTYEIFASGSNGMFYLLDTRGNGTIAQKEQVHSDAIMDFAISKNEDCVITSSLDMTINLVKIVSIN